MRMKGFERMYQSVHASRVGIICPIYLISSTYTFNTFTCNNIFLLMTH